MVEVTARDDGDDLSRSEGKSSALSAPREADTIEAVAAVVLRAHEHWHHEGGCSCGWKLTKRDFGRWSEAHRAHVAAVLADALAPTIAEREAAAEARALRVVRQVEADMSEHALAAWRSADARSGLSDHDAILTHADALTRWSERFRMAFDGDYYAAAARGVEGGA